MTIPAFVLSSLVWAAYLLVAAGSLYLLIVLVKEWLTGDIW